MTEESVSTGPDETRYPTLTMYATPLLEPVQEIIGREEEKLQVLASLARPRLSNLLLLGPAGSGKLLTLDTPIPTPAGWTTMGELSVGDQVLGQDGKPTRVTFLSEVDENPELYDLTFSDGSVVRACADHQWLVSSAAQREAGHPSRRRRTSARREADEARREALLELATGDLPEFLTASELLEVIADVPGITWTKSDALRTYLKRQGVPYRRGLRDRPRLRRGRQETLHVGVVELDTRLALKVLAEQRRRSKTFAADGSVNESVLTTKQMLEAGVRMAAQGGRANFSIRVAAPLDLPEADLPMDPYALGVWLGDGSRRFSKQALITSMDPQVIERMCSRGGYSARGEVYQEGSKALLYRVPGLGSDLSAAGIEPLGEKYIPEAFLRGSYEQRLELLRGLLDTDGFVDDQGAVELTFSGDQLAEGAEELIRTLGIKVKRKVGEAGYKDENGAFVRCQNRYRMHFTTDLPVFTLPRRAEKLPDSVRATQKLLYVESITPAPSEPGRCIQVDNADHMYLAGRGLTPTHNTVLVQETMMADRTRLYLEVDLAKMIANLHNPDELAARIKELFDEAEAFSRDGGRELVLFIDEFHQIVQLSAAAVEALKPVLAASGSRGIRVIAATTFAEYHQFIAQNQPLVERLQRINLTPANQEMVIRILRMMAEKEGVIADVGDDDGLFEQIYELTNRYIPASSQPRKSIQVLDAMIGWNRITGEPMSMDLIAKVIRNWTGANIAARVDGASIKQKLDERVYAQDLASRVLASRLQVVVADLQDKSRPNSSFLFCGSTGVGKTEMTKAIGDLMFGDDSVNRLIRFDMSEFALEKSLDLFRSELTKRVSNMGEAIILLDEIEKANPVVMRLLLQVLDDGRLSDDHGREVSFLNTYIVLTTNAGSEVFKAIGTYASDDTGSGEAMEDFMKAIHNSLKIASGFPPELLGRIDAIVPFQPLSMETKRKIIDRGLRKLRSEVMSKHGVELRINAKVLDYLSEDVADDDAEAGGARGALRTLRDEVTTEVAKFINEHPLQKVLMLRMEGELRADNKFLRKSAAKPKVSVPV